MTIIERIEGYLSGTQEKDFYKYSAVGLSILVVILGFFIYRHYSKIGTLKKQIGTVNEYREEMKLLLDDFARVEQQRAAVDAMLDKEPNFKIGGYFKTLLQALNLSDKKLDDTISHTTRHKTYRETQYKVRFTDISMRQLSELLDKVESNDRLSVKELDITQSKKQPGAIEATVTASTLQRKAEPSP